MGDATLAEFAALLRAVLGPVLGGSVDVDRIAAAVAAVRAGNMAAQSPLAPHRPAFLCALALVAVQMVRPPHIGPGEYRQLHQLLSLRGYRSVGYFAARIGAMAGAASLVPQRTEMFRTVTQDRQLLQIAAAYSALLATETSAAHHVWDRLTAEGAALAWQGAGAVKGATAQAGALGLGLAWQGAGTVKNAIGRALDHSVNHNVLAADSRPADRSHSAAAAPVGPVDKTLSQGIGGLYTAGAALPTIGLVGAAAAALGLAYAAYRWSSGSDAVEHDRRDRFIRLAMFNTFEKLRELPPLGSGPVMPELPLPLVADEPWHTEVMQTLQRVTLNWRTGG